MADKPVLEQWMTTMKPNCSDCPKEHTYECPIDLHKSHDMSIYALKQAKTGLFGDADQIKLTYSSLIAQRDLIIDMITTSERAINRIKYYEDIPKGDETCLQQAKQVLLTLKGVFIVSEPTEQDTVGNVVEDK